MTLPASLYHKMAACYYGQAARYWQIAEVETVEEPVRLGPDPSPHPTRHMYVPPIPPTWKPGAQQDGDNEIPTT